MSVIITIGVRSMTGKEVVIKYSGEPAIVARDGVIREFVLQDGADINVALARVEIVSDAHKALDA